MSTCTASMKLPFGKHKGRHLMDVADDDLLYLDWLNGEAWFLERYPRLAQAVAEICATRAHEIDSLIEDD